MFTDFAVSCLPHLRHSPVPPLEVCSECFVSLNRVLIVIMMFMVTTNLRGWLNFDMIFQEMSLPIVLCNSSLSFLTISFPAVPLFSTSFLYRHPQKFLHSFLIPKPAEFFPGLLLPSETEESTLLTYGCTQACLLLLTSDLMSSGTFTKPL